MSDRPLQLSHNRMVSTSTRLIACLCCHFIPILTLQFEPKRGLSANCCIHISGGCTLCVVLFARWIVELTHPFISSNSTSYGVVRQCSIVSRRLSNVSLLDCIRV